MAKVHQIHCLLEMFLGLEDGLRLHGALWDLNLSHCWQVWVPQNGRLSQVTVA